MASLHDFYIKINGVAGESKDSKHKEWIDVVSFRYGVSQSNSLRTGGGGGVAKARFSVLSFYHYIDRASPILMQFCAAGKHIPEVILSCCKVGGGSQEFMRVTLSDCIITHVGPDGATGNAPILEGVGIAYSSIRIEVKEQAPDGSMGAAVTGTWDVKRNIA